MAKQQKDLTLTESDVDKSLAVPENLRGGLVVEGQDDSTSMARLHLYQGTPEEVQKYGDDTFKRGDFIDTLERRKIADPTIMVLDGFTTWSRWEQGQRAPVYTFTDKADVPPEDLEWREVGGKRQPPIANECVNLIVTVKGEPFPFLLRVKRTGLGCWKDTIQPNEKRRGMAGKAPGAYTLSAKDDKNPAGQPYKRLAVSRMAEPDEEMLATASGIKAGIKAWKAKAAAAASEDEGTPDAGGDGKPPI